MGVPSLSQAFKKMVGQKSVDGDGNQWREVAGGEETIQRPEEAEEFEEISKISPVGIYILTLSV